MTIPSLLDLIGNTPLLRLNRSVRDLPKDVEVFIKAEWFNPGGSVKDRAARHIVLAALRGGHLKLGGTLLDASSGNTGIAYAMLGAHLGFKLALCIPQNANSERKRTLLAYGAELIYTDPNDGSDGAIREAQRLHRENPGLYFFADQYSNTNNILAHYEGTGPELWRQTQGQISHFVCGLGTTGTCMGVARFLREKKAEAKVVAVQPDGPFHGLEGLKHLDSALVPAIYDEQLPHEQQSSVTENAYIMTRRLAREEGLLVGISTGAAVDVALRIARAEATAGSAASIVALAPDAGTRYLSEHFWDEK